MLGIGRSGQAASLSGYAMTRQVLIVVGTVLLSFGGVGIVVGLAWLTASHLHGTLPYILDERTEMLIFALPALLLVAIVGAAFVAGALAAFGKDERPNRTLHPHTRFRA